jgi:hypothetical protein
MHLVARIPSTLPTTLPTMLSCMIPSSIGCTVASTIDCTLGCILYCTFSSMVVSMLPNMLVCTLDYLMGNSVGKAIHIFGTIEYHIDTTKHKSWFGSTNYGQLSALSCQYMHAYMCMHGWAYKCARHLCTLRELTSQLMEWICGRTLRDVTSQLMEPSYSAGWLVTPRTDILRELTRTDSTPWIQKNKRLVPKRRSQCCHHAPSKYITITKKRINSPPDETPQM